MAVAAARREGSLEPALGAGVGQGVQMRGPPCPADPPPRRRYSDSCCPWRICDQIFESEPGVLSLYKPKGPLPEPTSSS